MWFHGTPTVLRCAACGAGAVARAPSDEERDAWYQEEYYDQDDGERFSRPLEWIVRGFRWLRVRAILRRIPGPASILDVGCGRGILLELLRKRGWRAAGTQISRTAGDAALRRRGVEVFVGELPDLDLPPRSVDVITLFHVIEHLPEPGEYLRVAHGLLKDDGLLVVECPNCAGPGFRWLGCRHLCIDHPHHLVFFTPASLERLLEDHGFQVLGRSHFSLEYSPFTTLQNLLNLLPGEPNRLYRSLLRNSEGQRLRRSSWTWLHWGLAPCLAVPALVLSALGLVAPVGNTMRFYCRKRRGEGR